MSVERAITPHFSDDTEIFVPAEEAPYRPAAPARRATPAQRPARQPVHQQPARERALTGPALVAAASRRAASVSAQVCQPYEQGAPVAGRYVDAADEDDEEPDITETPQAPTWTPVLRQVPAGEYDAHVAAVHADQHAPAAAPVRPPLTVVAPEPEQAPAAYATTWTSGADDPAGSDEATEGWSAAAWSTQGGWADQSWPTPPVSTVEPTTPVAPTPRGQAARGQAARGQAARSQAAQGQAARSAPRQYAPRPAPTPPRYEMSAPPAWLSDAPVVPQLAAPQAPPVRRAAPLVSSAPVVGSLAPDTMLRRSSPAGSGWRRTVAGLTGGLWNPGPSAIETEQAERLRCIRTPVRSCRRIAVMSVKGGVGKTTVASMLGLTFADLRSDRVLAVDANPDLGTLADRLTGDVEIGIQHLLDFLSDAPTFSVTDIEAFVSTNGRLQVLAGSREPASGAAFTPEEYEEAIAALSSCYSVMVVDTGTGLSHSALAGVLATADDVVIVAEPTVDAASRASMTLDWLASCGLTALAEDAIVVMSHDRGSREIDDRAIRDHFATRCGAVIEVPADPHLAAGGRIDRARCRPATRAAFEELAAVVGEGFSHPAAGGR